MSREKRTVFIVVLTLIVYSVSQFLETGEFIFPFPIFDSILLLIFFQFIYWNRKEIFEKKSLYLLFYLLAIIFKVISGPFFLSFIYGDQSLEQLNIGLLVEICKIISFLFLASFFSSWNWKKGQITSLFLSLSFIILSLSSLFESISYVGFFAMPLFVSYLFLTKSRSEFHYLFLLNAILDLMAILMLTRLN